MASIGRGQDANWDLQNYHFYVPWALRQGRLLSWDIAAAQLQTYHNPALDLVFQAMVALDWPPPLVAFVLSIPAGIGAYFLARIIRLLFRGNVGAGRSLLPVAAFAIGITGAVGFAVLGTTMNEWPAAMLTLAALWLLLRAIVALPEAALPVRPLVAAGIVLGLASGLKLTAATYALGMAIALLCRRPQWRDWRAGVREAGIFGIGVVGGLAVSIGWWWLTLWSHFGNPLFPYANEWFRSPWWYDVSVLGRAYGPHDIGEWLAFPYDLFRAKPFFVAEVLFRDARMPTIYTLALTTGAVSLAAYLALPSARRRARTPRASAAPWYFVGFFWLASFLLWTEQYSIYRYLLPLELLSGALIVGLVRQLVRTRALPVVVTILALTIIGTTRWPDWGHVDFGDRWFEVGLPPVAPDALVLLASDAPMAYLLPYLPPSARHVGAYNNIIRPGQETGLAEWVARTIREHPGPIYALTHSDAMAQIVYDAHGLTPVPGGCAEVRTNIRSERVELCRLERSGVR